MILNPDVASVLDKAADYIVRDTAVMPSTTKAYSNNREGFDAESAIAYAMIDMDYMDDVEMRSGCPHLTEIMTAVADFGGVPEFDRFAQDLYFEGAGANMAAITRRSRRRNDVLMWARGLATDEVANLFRWTADDFRAKPADTGVYDTEGTHEVPEVRNGTVRELVVANAQATREGNPIAPLLGMALAQATLDTFQSNAIPDPDAGVVVKREDVSAARIAEIAQGVIDLMNQTGWTASVLVNPETGGLSTMGATALTVGLPLHMRYLTSKVHQTERRWAEMWRFVNAMADHLGLVASEQVCAGCGTDHDQDPDARVAAWEERDGMDIDHVLSALTDVRDAYVAVAAYDAGYGNVDDFDFDTLTRQLSDGGTEG